MATVKLSSKYQIVIPKAIREKMNLKAGEFFHLIKIGDRLELIPVRSIKENRGFLEGLDLSFEREGDSEYS